MRTGNLTRRRLLAGTITAAASPIFAYAQERRRSALALARILNRTTFGELPPVSVKHAKMILASTMASAASGTGIGSARIIRDLAKEQGGKPEAPIWFDGTKLPVNQAARVNAMLSDAAASDDSDLRNVAHIGTCLTAVGLALSERMGATGQDLLCAMVTGYEAAGRISEAVGRPGEALSGS